MRSSRVAAPLLAALMLAPISGAAAEPDARAGVPHPPAGEPGAAEQPAVNTDLPDRPALKAGVFSPARLAPDFRLRGSDDSELTLSRYRGKVVVVVFGFTSCPEVCPTTLSTLAKARKQLDDDAAGLQVVYITVDPDRDSAEHLREYLRHFDATFVGATGTAAELDAVRKEYGIFANKLAVGETYSFNHSSYTYLVDPDGKLRALMPYGQQPDAYVHDVRVLLGKPATGVAESTGDPAP